MDPKSDLKPWNPWEELAQIQAVMDAELRIFLDKLRQGVPGNPIAFVPSLDLVESPDEYIFFLALPGMVEEDIDITLQGRLLILRGERDVLYDPRQVTVHQSQWKYGFFERRIELPQAVSSDQIQASYEAGVLSVRVPKSAPSASTPGGSA